MAVLTLTGTASVVAFADEAAQSTATAAASKNKRTLEEINELLNTISYEEYLDKYADSNGSVEHLYAKKGIVLNAADYDKNSTDAAVIVKENYEGTTGPSLYLPDTGAVGWVFDVPADGMYTISLEYFPVEAKSADIERMLLVNGKVLFSEARTLKMNKIWSNIYTSDTKDETGRYALNKDLNGNDIRPRAAQTPEWRTYVVNDSTGYYNDALLVYLKAGKNVISLEALREPVVIRTISLNPPENKITQADYLAKYPNASAGQSKVLIQAETPEKFSDESIYPITDRTSATTMPQNSSARLLNTIGSSVTYRTAGQWVAYEFSVDSSGLYNIAARFRQAELAGMFTSRTVKIGYYDKDGKLIQADALYDENYYCRFLYSKEWQLSKLGNGEEPFVFYFEAGVKYVIELEVSLGDLADTVREVEEALANINACYLEILKLTGSNPDQYRDYGFSRLMPEVLNTFVKESRRLTRIAGYLTELCGDTGSHVATLNKIAYLLEEMGTDEDRIAARLKTLKSDIGTLGTWLNNSRNQPVQFDYLLIIPSDYDLEGSDEYKAKDTFFKAFWYEIKLFISSFFVDYGTMGSTTETDTEDSVEVWLTSGRDQSLIIRNMVDSSFIQNYGIGVEVKLVAGGTLLPSVLSGQGPDVFMGIGAADTINYAIRNAIIPLNDFEGFDEITAEFTEAALIPITLEGVTYGLPMDMPFSMMFYRQDILANLGIEVPETWDDVLSAVTVLQANNMNVGLQRDSDLFLYQLGGNRYVDNGMRTGLDTNIALKSFEYYCSFYSKYSFPESYDGPNRFRTGEMPLLIGNYTAIYNTLTVFATELQGLWNFTVLPGVQKEDGTINNCAVAAVNALIMLHGAENQEGAWKFIKWFCGEEAQTQYCSQLITTIGNAAKHPTANKMALLALPWTAAELESLNAQFNNIAAIANYPGGYIADRYLNFAFLANYKSKVDPIEKLRSYIITINKEITRKRQEFGMETLELGQTLAEKRRDETVAILKGLSGDAAARAVTMLEDCAMGRTDIIAVNEVIESLRSSDASAYALAIDKLYQAVEVMAGY